MFRGSYVQGLLHPGVLTIRGSYIQGILRSGVRTFRGSYIQGFLRSGVLTIRVLTSRGCYVWGLLHSGVVHLRLFKEGELYKGVFVKSRGRCYIQGYAQLPIMKIIDSTKVALASSNA